MLTLKSSPDPPKNSQCNSRNNSMTKCSVKYISTGSGETAHGAVLSIVLYSLLKLSMALAASLTELEAQSCGVGICTPLESSGLERLQQLVKTSKGLPVSVDCRRKILVVSDDDIAEVIVPLCSWLKGLAEAPNGEAGGGGRVLVGIVGPAAAGKSTLAQLLCAAGDVLWGDSYMQSVSMDGYSFPNSYLSAEPAVDHRGRPCTLKDVKGLPSTLDAGALLRDLRRLRSADDMQTVLLPAYSRDLHDPVPDCVNIAPDCRIVIIEGLHLLHKKGQWKDISAALHRTMFLNIERSCCFERVVGRKVANGRSRESSEAHFSRVDGPTFDQLQEERFQASLVLTVRPTEDRPLRIVDVEARLGPK